MSSTERVVELNYQCSDFGRYERIIEVDDPSKKLITPRSIIRPDNRFPDHERVALPDRDFGNSMDDTINLRNAMRAKYDERPGKSLGREPGNQITVSVVLPESEAKALLAHFEQNPAMIRSFFVNGSIGLQYLHNPPDYKGMDASNPNAPIWIRRIEGTNVNDTLVNMDGTKKALDAATVEQVLTEAG